MDKNKIGFFVFPINIFHEQTGVMFAVFQSMKVLSSTAVEVGGGRPAIKYKAVHPEFRELEEGDEIPYYKISIGVTGIDFEELSSPPPIDKTK